MQTYWSEIIGMREEDSPRIANPFVELDWATSGLCFKVWCNVSESEWHFILISVDVRAKLLTVEFSDGFGCGLYG